jgi:aspartate/methionine/tyrosine aminotransferase
LLQRIVNIAKKFNIIIFCDEVFRPLFHEDAPQPPPLVSLWSKNTISSGSLSKSFGLPGVRVGWVVSPDKSLIRKIMVARDYTTTTVSRLDDSIAAFTLHRSVFTNLIQRNLELCRESIQLIDVFVRRNPQVRWSWPEGGGTAFVQILDKKGVPVDDAGFCAKLAEEEGLCIIPCGWCFRDDGTDDFKGYLRFPLGQPDILRKGLPMLQNFLLKLD